MEITRLNYEIYFLDYLEGKFDLSNISDLMIFLKENPDLADELRQFENITIHSNEIIFNEKNVLKKPAKEISLINENNFEEFCIAELEGDLSLNDKLIFNKFLIENPSKKKVFEFYLNTMLRPDKKIFFKEKSKLKANKINKHGYSFSFIVSAAASVCLMFMVYKYIYNYKTFPDKQLVTTQNRTPVALNNKNKSFINTHQMAILLLIKKSANNNLSFNNIESVKNKIEKNAIRRNNNTMNSIKSLELKELKKSNSEIVPIFSIIVDNKNIVIEKDNSFLSENFVIKGAEKVIDNYYSNIKNQYDLNFWHIASSGIKEFNKILGPKIKFNKKVDTDSNRTIYSFNSNLLSFYRSHENK